MSDNIVGKDHLDYVKSQISARQEILGKFNKDSEDIVWQDNRNSWIRLMSSVDISDEQVLKFNETIKEDQLVSNNGAEFRNQYLGLEGYGGPKLAQELILQGGTLNYNEPKFGVTNNISTSPESNFNYGFGGNQFGQKPMPGITSFSSNTYNKGSLRKAQLQITAHNTQQFNYIESTYLKLGYTVLLEWGNTKYPITNEDGSIRYSTPSDIAALSLKDEFLYSYDKGSSYFYTLIEKLRRTSQGNYDGFLGRVENFSWEFTKEGSYSITLDLISIGSVVESLKINTNLDSIFYIPLQEGFDTSTPEEDRPSALESAIDMLANTQFSFSENDAFVFVKYNQAVNSIAEGYEKPLGLSTEELNPKGYVMSLNASYGGSGVVGKSDNVYENITYLRLGTLLDFINKKLLLYNRNSNPSLIEIDTNIDTYCYSNGWSFSGNPRKMVNKLVKDNNLWSSETTGDSDIAIFPLAENFHDILEDGTPVGRVMNLYFSRDYLVKTLKEQVNEEGDLLLYDFLKSILNTTNKLLGNVNKLNLRIVNKEFKFTEEEIPQAIDLALITKKDIIPNEDGTFSIIREVIEIYDEVRTKKIDTNPIFNIYGFNPNESKTIKDQVIINDETGETQTFDSSLRYNGGSFITDFNLKTEITKKLATQIAIGAQANGSSVGKDTTIFSKWNIGLVDRVIPSKLDIDKASRDTAQSYIDFLKLKNLYLKYLEFLYNTKEATLISDPQNIASRNAGNKTVKTTAYTIPSLYLSSTSDEKPVFLKFETIQQQFFQKILSYDAERKEISNPFIGFIPINLSLTMDGLSGIRIFDKLTVNSKFLPSNYTETLDFIITQLDHKFEGEKWVTNIGTLSMPKLFNKRAEVILDEYLDIDNLQADENRIYENSTEFPSYFYIKPEVVIGVRKGTTGKRIEIDELLTYLNDSGFVQNKFRKFFNDLIDLFPTGYQFTINSIVRKLDTVTGVGLNSEHIWGLSIDMAVREAKPDGGFSQNILYGLEQTPEGRSKWNSTDIPRIAAAAGLRWGGNWTTGSWKYDTVHFGAVPGWDNYKTIPKDLLKTAYPKLETLIQEAIDGSERNAKNIISGLDLTNFLDIQEKDGTLVITIDTSKDNEKLPGSYNIGTYPSGYTNGIRFMRANGGQIITPSLIR